MQHVFCDDTTLIDLRYLVAAEVFDLDDEEDAEPEHGIGYVLEVGHTPQRLSTTYPTREQRDSAFGRLVGMYQAWIAHVHATDSALN
jgi:hypothetical protein